LNDERSLCYEIIEIRKARALAGQKVRLPQKGSFMSAGSTGFTKLAQATVLASFIAIPANDVWAETDFTAGTVMTKMNSEERFAYVAGIVEGLSYARYLKDSKKPDGMQCIDDWFYKDKTAYSSVQENFEKFPDHYPVAILSALINKKCGE
jgi:hypothetical protein